MFELLRAWSPLYDSLLEAEPALAAWLEPESARDWRARDFARAFSDLEPEGPLLPRLRRFRRRACLRIAAREVEDLAPVEQSLEELTLLAEFVLGRLLEDALARWQEKLGTPWDEELDRPARFCVLGLGKFGARELNFCSDLDLIYVYEGDGACRRGERETSTTSGEFFGRVAQDLTAQLHQRAPEGFLYNIDLRLRPEGDAGPLVRSVDAMEHYYYTAGQTWERLALIKARSVAGHPSVADELFERLNPFRFPRHPPPRLLEGIAAVKRRTEREVVGGEDLERHLKSGPGGIREIEFFVQALQMLNAGRNPFLQEPSTLGAIEKLTRYSLIEGPLAKFLRSAYLRLRRLENLVQLREEKQTHTLPREKEELELMARIGPLEGLEEVRRRVAENYRAFFPEPGEEIVIDEWTSYFSGEAAGGEVAATLGRWFGAEAAEAETPLREFVAGEATHVLTREQVELFIGLRPHIGRVFTDLARPLEVLRRLGAFSRRYGLPKQFLKACHADPRFFEALSRLFDRSRFVHEELLQHPEIIEEVLGPGYLRDKSVEQHREEMAHGAKGDAFADWLRLYVRAEEVRFMARELLSAVEPTPRATAESLGTLADAVMAECLERTGARSLGVIALGKYGGGELTFGSDLDIVVIGQDQEATIFQRFLRLVRHAFPIDLRLRPWGDAGAMVATPDAFRDYPLAVWERLAWTRARAAAGPAALAADFLQRVDAKVFAPLGEDEVHRLGEIRRLMESEKGQPPHPGDIAYKAGRGGVVDIEFLAHRWQIHHGLRGRDIRELLADLASLGALSVPAATTLRDHYEFLRRVEHAARRDTHTALSVLPAELLPALAVWTGFEGDLAAELRRRMEETRALAGREIAIPTFPE